MPLHTVKQGECMNQIADQYGTFWETLWNHPQNSALRDSRGNPNVLMADDKVFIPEKEQKEEPCATTQTHVFRLRGVPVKLVFRLEDIDWGPRDNVPYTLMVDGEKKGE